ncbi:MAG TPA: hypothetical protein PKE04_09890, partial [Clostridia bacterium]|nr:hypothetical protein [Clostridia bacterium]
MKHWFRIILLAALLTLSGTALAEQKVTLPLARLETAFPDGWTVVTPETAANHASLVGVPAEIAGDALRSENVIAAAYAPGGNPFMRIRMESDADTQVYFDIERYTADMRTAIKNEYLDTEVWSLMGLRFTEAAWKNSASIGRYLRLTYYRREEGEIVSRGLMAHTVRNGYAYILEIQADGRKLSAAETKQFEQTLGATRYVPQLDMPLLPVGLALNAPLPEEVCETAFTLRGNTEPGAAVTAWLQFLDEEPFRVGETKARNSGTFTLEVALPGEGMWQMYLRSELEGFEESSMTVRLTCDLDQIPVNLTHALEGEVWDAQPRLEGTALAGATLTLIEGESTVERRTSDGSFSFKLDPETAGPRTVSLTVRKAGYPDRTLTYSFERHWQDADYAAYLQDRVQGLSYANLSGSPAKYAGRLVSFSGVITDFSSGGGQYYLRLAVTEKKGAWTDEMIFVTEEDLLLAADDQMTCYGVVTGEPYPIPLPPTEDEE